MAKTGLKQQAKAGESSGPIRNGGIGEEVRLQRFRTQFAIRRTEQRAYDPLPQDLIQGEVAIAPLGTNTFPRVQPCFAFPASLGASPPFGGAPS